MKLLKEFVTYTLMAFLAMLWATALAVTGLAAIITIVLL